VGYEIRDAARYSPTHRNGCHQAKQYLLQVIRKKCENRTGTYSERFDSSELLDNGFFLGEVGGTDSESGGGDDWQTDWNTDNQEDKCVVEKIDGAVHWGGDWQVVEETTDPGEEDEENDQDQKRRTDGVHDSLEVTLILSAGNQRCSATNEGHLGGVSDNGISLSTLATSSVVDGVGDVLVDSERFSSHGRLINGEKSVTRTVFLAGVVTIIFLKNSITTLCLELSEIFCVTVGVVVTRDNSTISWDDGTIFDDNL